MGEQKKSAKQGRNKAKCAEYKAEGRRYIAKLGRILDANGPDAALAYADKYQCWSSLKMLRRKKPVAYQRAIDTSMEFHKFALGG